MSHSNKALLTKNFNIDPSVRDPGKHPACATLRLMLSPLGWYFIAIRVIQCRSTTLCPYFGLLHSELDL